MRIQPHVRSFKVAPSSRKTVGPRSSPLERPALALLVRPRQLASLLHAPLRLGCPALLVAATPATATAAAATTPAAAAATLVCCCLPGLQLGQRLSARTWQSGK